MRVALCDEVLAELPFGRRCAPAAALGYDGPEVAPSTLDREAPHLLPAAAAAGLPVVSLHWLLVAPAGLPITEADPGVRARALGVMERLVGLAADLGTRVPVHGSPGQRRPPAPGDAGRAEGAMARAGAWAAAAGLVCCLEPLAPREADWATVGEAAAVVRRVGSPGLRTMLDCCAAGNGDAEPAAALLWRWLPSGLLAHVHLDDRNRRAPGQGADRSGPVLAALRRAGCGGRCAVEPFEHVPGGPGAAARAIGYPRGSGEGMEA